MSRENSYGVRNKLFYLENYINFSVFVFVFEDTKEVFVLLVAAVSLPENTITFLPYQGHINLQERLVSQYGDAERKLECNSTAPCYCNRT